MEELVIILANDIRKFHTRMIFVVMVQRSDYPVEEATREIKSEI